jgi:uncharacterized protein YkwD
MGWLTDIFRRWRPRPMPPPPRPRPAPDPIPNDLVADLLARHNAERQARGLAPLGHDPRLSAAAAGHARWMAATGRLSHDEPGGRDPFRRIAEQGIRYSAAGENIAAGQTDAAQVVGDWLASPGHRRNVLNPNFHAMGAAAVNAANGTRYWVVDYTS